MEIIIIRTYYMAGTNGLLYINAGEFPLCRTIELPWLQNKTGVSCIPEGRYRIRMRYSHKFSHHLEVTDVPGRSMILVHPANDAKRELRGCIAPVTIHTGEGKGSRSKIAFNMLLQIVKANLKTGPVYITIKKTEHDNQRKG